jgi:exo-beta-1,3-glucanase (GH17 family)
MKPLWMLLLLVCALPAFADDSVACRRKADVRPSLDRLQQVMAEGRFIAYQPIIADQAAPVDEAGVLADLKVLRSRFDGLITYGSLKGAERIPDVAARLGFRAVIMGVWDLANQQEIDNVVAAWRRFPEIVVGISIGNEVVFGRRGDYRAIARAIDAVRKRAPGLALTTTEPFHLFYEPAAAAVLSTSDFMLVNVHPVFQPWFAQAADANAAEFVVNVVDRLASIYCGPILVKETGVPTAPAAAGFTDARQASFYSSLAQRFPPTTTRAFAYFSAFDAPWRAGDAHPVAGDHPEEAHWGLYDARRMPKPAVDVIPTL